MCRLSLTPRQMQEALTPGHLKKAKLMFFFTRYPSSTLLKTYFLDVQVERQHPVLVPGRAPVQHSTQPAWLGNRGEGGLSCSPASLAGAGGQHPPPHRLPWSRCSGPQHRGCQVFALCN